MTITRGQVKTIRHTARVPDEEVTTERVREEPEVRTEPVQRVYRKKKTIFRAYQIIWYLFGFIEVLLLFRFFLKFLGANAGSAFVSLIYGLSNPLAIPFFGIFAPVSTGPIIIEWSTIIAMIVYWVVAWGLVE